MTTNNTKPAHEIRVGSVTATIWQNQSRNAHPFFSATFTRLYKAGDAWKRSASFGPREMLNLQKAADLAFNWIAQQSATPTVDADPLDTAPAT